MASSSDPRPQTSPAQKLGLILFGLLLTALGLALLEGVLALTGVGDDARLDDPYVGFEGSRTLFVRTGDTHTTRPEKLTFFNAQSFPADKGPDTLRVFTLGGSTTFGRPYDDRVSFGRWLERYLDDAEPGRRHEVINAGGISYASYRITRLFQELLDYEPDLFVLYTGHNEFLEERTYGQLTQRSPWRKRVDAGLSKLRSATVLRRALGRGAETSQKTVLGDAVQAKLEVWTGLQAYTRDDAQATAITEHFGLQLDRMAALAADHDVPLILVAPASNLADFSPFKSQHGDAVPASDRRRIAEILTRARDRSAGPVSLDELVEARDLDPAYAETHFRLGRALLALDRVDAARQAFVQARELDVAPLRAPGAIVEHVRAAAERHGLPLVDLLVILRQTNPIPGNDHFLDHVHPDIPVHQRLARDLVRRLADGGWVEIDGDPEPAWAATDRRVLAGLDRTYYAQRDLNLAKVLGWAGKLEEAEAPLLRAAEVLDGDLDLHLNLGTLWQKMGRPDDALQHLRRAVELAPDNAEAQFNLGVVYGQTGALDAGVAALREALRLRGGDYPEALFNLGVLQREGGDLDGALATFERALVRGQVPEIYRALGRTLRLAGRPGEAETVLRRGLEATPDDPRLALELALGLADQGRFHDAETRLDAWLPRVEEPSIAAEILYNLGVLRARDGRLDAARRAYERALDAAPRHGASHVNLGVLLARQGDTDGALRHLGEALEIDPENAEAHFNVGVVLDAMGRPQGALAAVRRAAELDPDNARIQDALGRLLAVQQP